MPCVTWLVAAEVDGGIERGSDQGLRGLCELQVLVVAEVDGGSERGCDRGLRGLCGPNVSMVTSLDKKSVKTLCGSGPRGLLRQMFSPLFCRGYGRQRFCAAEASRPLWAKCSVVTSTDKKSVKHLSSSGLRGLCGKCVLTDFLSRKSTTAVLSPKRLRGLGGSKVLTVTSLGKKSVCALSCSGSRGLLRQMCSPFFCRGNRRRRRSVSI